jgi:hypothetical protein
VNRPHWKYTRNVRKTSGSPSKPIVGVNHRAVLRRAPENSRAEPRQERATETHRHSLRPPPPSRARPQVTGYVEETTPRRSEYAESGRVNNWGRTIRAGNVWLPEKRNFEPILQAHTGDLVHLDRCHKFSNWRISTADNPQRLNGLPVHLV